MIAPTLSTSSRLLGCYKCVCSGAIIIMAHRRFL
jgi:hypothetical protein